MSATAEVAAGVDLLRLLVVDLRSVRHHLSDWISAQTLALGSVLLPSTGAAYGLLCLDLPDALRHAALLLSPQHDRPDARVDAARSMLAHHLADSYLIPSPDRGPRLELDSWLLHASPLVAIREMQAAAWFARLRLLTAEFGQDGMYAHLARGPGWQGALRAARDHPFSITGNLRQHRESMA